MTHLGLLHELLDLFITDDLGSTWTNDRSDDTNHSNGTPFWPLCSGSHSEPTPRQPQTSHSGS